MKTSVFVSVKNCIAAIRPRNVMFGRMHKLYVSSRLVGGDGNYCSLSLYIIAVRKRQFILLYLRATFIIGVPRIMR